MVTQNGVEHLLSSIYVGNLELKKMHLELVFVGSFKFLTLQDFENYGTFCSLSSAIKNDCN